MTSNTEWKAIWAVQKMIYFLKDSYGGYFKRIVGYNKNRNALTRFRTENIMQALQTAPGDLLPIF